MQDEGKIKSSKLSLSQCGLVGWMVGLMRGARNESRSGRKQMYLRETLPLGGKRQLMLVSCGREYFLVGGGMESIETIVQVRNQSLSDPVDEKLEGMRL